MRNISKQKKIAIFISILTALLIILIVIVVFRVRFERYWALVRDPASLQSFVSWIDSVGPAGIPVLIVCQISQIVIAFLPGGLIELASGMLYGVWLGLLISMTGISIGSFAAGKISKIIGKKIIQRFVPSRQFDHYIAFCENKRFLSLILFFFFLPGVPKDLLIYAVGLSGTLTFRFWLLITLVRIPSVLVAVMAGDKFGSGEFTASFVIYGCFLIVGLVGSIIHRLVLRKAGTNG